VIILALEVRSSSVLFDMLPILWLSSRSTTRRLADLLQRSVAKKLQFPCRRLVSRLQSHLPYDLHMLARPPNACAGE
jgi:hypothetical protein